MTKMRQVLCIVALTGCGIFAALLSHGAFSVIESVGLLGSGYEDRPHASLPLALCAVLLAACAVAVLYFVQAINGGSRRHVVALARHFGQAPTLLPLVAVACIAIAALAGMESLEGHANDAFGSIAPLGMAMVTAIAACLGLALRAFARWIADATESLVSALFMLLSRAPAGPKQYRRRHVDAFLTRRIDALIRICGNRAPPRLLA